MSAFTSVKLTDFEKISGSVLTDLQKAVIQNRISEVAHQLLQLEYNEHSPLEFVKQQSFAKAQIAELQYMLDAANNAEEVLKTPELFAPDGSFMGNFED